MCTELNKTLAGSSDLFSLVSCSAGDWCACEITFTTQTVTQTGTYSLDPQTPGIVSRKIVLDSDDATIDASHPAYDQASYCVETIDLTYLDQTNFTSSSIVGGLTGSLALQLVKE